MANPFLDLWLGSVCAWTGAACSPLSTEMLWMSPTPQRKCGVGERMAALSLWVVEGGRR
jgi:hypothetical protein